MERGPDRRRTGPLCPPDPNGKIGVRLRFWRGVRFEAAQHLDRQKSLNLVRADDPGGHGADQVALGRWKLERVEDAPAGGLSRIKRGAKRAFHGPSRSRVGAASVP